jgi:hypothetical protein
MEKYCDNNTLKYKNSPAIFDWLMYESFCRYTIYIVPNPDKNRPDLQQYCKCKAHYFYFVI